MFLQFIDKLPYPTLIIVALLMLAAPFVSEPHLLEKMRMLMDGTLTKPLDMFDVVWHLLPAILLGVKFVRSRRNQP